jgi:putative membrane protein
MELLFRWAITAGALYATVLILQQFKLAASTAHAWYSWFIAVLIMALVNALIRPVARLLTAPLNCLTFGIMGIVVNAVMFWLVPVIMDAAGFPVFRVSVLGALAGSVMVGLLGGLLSQVLIRKDDQG